MTDHQECFGKMFPDVLHIPNDQVVKGKVFSVLLERAGGLWRCNRKVAAEVSEWDKCRECRDFDNCYKFCTAKLLLESAISTE